MTQDDKRFKPGAAKPFVGDLGVRQGFLDAVSVHCSTTFAIGVATVLILSCLLNETGQLMALATCWPQLQGTN